MRDLTYPPPDDFAQLFSRLRRVSGATPGKWRASCPVHNTKDQSLSLSLTEGGDLLMHCNGAAACDNAAILAHLGLSFSVLYRAERRMSKQEGKVVARYDYRNDAGEVEFQTLRWEPKGFSACRPNKKYDPSKPFNSTTNPKWIYDMKGVNLTLYCLAEVLQAVKEKPDRWVLVLEGEEDVKCALKAGITATCNPFGAGKWRPEFSERLRGCNVVVIPDEDQPGLAHAQDVCRSLHGVARTVRLVRLPGVEFKGDDFRDYWRRQDISETPLATRKSSLASLFKSTPLWSPDAPPPQMLLFSEEQALKSAPAIPANGSDEAVLPDAEEKPAVESPAAESGEVTAESAEALLAAAAGTDMVGVAAVLDVLKAAGTLRSTTHRLGNFAEWFGALWLDVENLKDQVKPERYRPDSAVDYGPIRTATVQACASILRGLLELEKMRAVQP